MSDFHRSLRTNERMSELLGFFEQVTHFLFHSGKMSDSIKKLKNCIFCTFSTVFLKFFKKEKDSLIPSEQSEGIAQVTQDK